MGMGQPLKPAEHNRYQSLALRYDSIHYAMKQETS